MNTIPFLNKNINTQTERQRLVNRNQSTFWAPHIVNQEIQVDSQWKQLLARQAVRAWCRSISVRFVRSTAAPPTPRTAAAAFFRAKRSAHRGNLPGDSLSMEER
jgi:hypothetical protein